MEMTSAAMRRPTFSFNEFPWEKGLAKAFLRQDFYAPLLHFSGLNRRTKLGDHQPLVDQLRLSTTIFPPAISIIWTNNYPNN